MVENNQEFILRQLVSSNSVFPYEANLAIFLEKYLKKLSFKTERHYISKNRWNIQAERGQGKSSLLFYCHMDTVPDYGNWSTNPYRLCTSGDKLFGLGSCDMKGGIASLLSALTGSNNGKVKILFGVDEENISEGVWRVIDEKKEWFKDVKFVLVGEPGASKTKIGGVNVITLGRRGRAVFEIEVFGKSAHGAHPEKGINALSEASKIALEIEKMKLSSNKYLGPATLFIRKINGESTSLSIPDKAIIGVDRHLVIPETIDSAKRQLEDLIKEMLKSGKLSKESDKKAIVSVKKRQTSYLSPYLTDINNPFVKEVISLIKNNFHRKVVINYGKSVADDNIFANVLKVPVITIGPMGGNIHSSNEWVSRKSLEDVANLYKMIIDRSSSVF